MLDINETLTAFQKLNVLVIGDIMLDAYYEGRVERVSPEAPVPVVGISKKSFRPGGAANVALNIRALGGNPFLISVVGKDTEGQLLQNLLPTFNISTKYIQVSTNRRTTSKARILAQNQHLLRLDEEDTKDLSPTESKYLLQTVEKILAEQEVSVMLFQDYNKGVLSESVIRQLLLLALKNDIPTIVDPKHTNFYTYQRVTLFKPNLKEVNANLPFSCGSTLTDLKKASLYIRERLNNPMTLITLSEKGIFYSHQGNEALLPTTPRKIADVCGAGDSVVSIAALGLALQLPLSEIALLANLVGGQVCEEVGVVSIDKEKLKIDYLNWQEQN